jgi:hypothetical protein
MHWAKNGPLLSEMRSQALTRTVYKVYIPCPWKYEKVLSEHTLAGYTRPISRVVQSTGILTSAKRFWYSDTPTRSINLTVLCPDLTISCPLQLLLFHTMFQCHLAGRAVSGEGPRREEPTLQQVSKSNKFGCSET